MINPLVNYPYYLLMIWMTAVWLLPMLKVSTGIRKNNLLKCNVWWICHDAVEMLHIAVDKFTRITKPPIHRHLQHENKEYLTLSYTSPGLHFLFDLGTPLWQSRKTLHEWRDNSVLAKPLAACTHLSSTVSQLFEPQVQKIAVFTFRSPQFCFPWRRPCDYHAICCMDEKTIQCLPNSSQRVPIYLQYFPSYTMLK